MEAKHTPGLLRYSKSGDGHYRIFTEQDKILLADCGAGSGPNAARFVLTWNVHDDLLAALEAIIMWKGGHNIMGENLCPVCSYPGKHKRGCPYPRIKKAIAKARGGE